MFQFEIPMGRSEKKRGDENLERFFWRNVKIFVPLHPERRSIRVNVCLVRGECDGEIRKISII